MSDAPSQDAPFQDNIYLVALTHSSWAHEHGGDHNERLEFLGDAVLELCISDLLYNCLPLEREGVLSRVRQKLVRKESLAQLSRELGLDQALRIGAGEEAAGLRSENKPLSDVWEAMLGAVYLQEGMQAARDVVAATVLPRLSSVRHTRDPKSELQEWSQRNHHGAVPAYKLVSRHGPDNDPVWTVSVAVADEVLGQGSARRKKDAESQAAAAALTQLGTR